MRVSSSVAKVLCLWCGLFWPLMVSAQDFACNARADFPLNGFVAQLSEQTGAGGFATTLRLQMNGVDLYADALSNLRGERRGESTPPASPMARMLAAAPALRQNGGFTAVASRQLAELLGGRESSGYFAAWRSDMSFVSSTLDNQIIASDRLGAALTAIRNDMLSWQASGLIARTKRQLNACATICAAPELVAAADVFETNYQTLSNLMRPTEFDRAMDGIVPHFFAYAARLKVLRAYARQAEAYVGATNFLTRDRAFQMATDPASVDEMIGYTRVQQADWIEQEAVLVTILRDAIIDRDKSGRARLRAGLEQVAAILDARNGLRRSLVMYQNACGA